MILTIDHSSVRELRLNRPPANALSPDLIRALTSAVQADEEQSGRVIVFCGAPGMFSAGLDAPLLLTLSRTQMAQTWKDFSTLLRPLATSPIPIAAAITGHAPAGGTVLALFCD